MTILIERIYNKTADISYITQDEFSTDFCGSKPSYLRSMKCRQMEASTSVLMTLMDALHQRAMVMRSGNRHPSLLQVADKYDALSAEVGEEIAKRSLQQAKASKWVRETLVRLINRINDDKASKSYSLPPIIIV